MLSLYTRVKFTTTSIIEELLDFVVDTDDSDESKYDVIKNYIDKKFKEQTINKWKTIVKPKGETNSWKSL